MPAAWFICGYKTVLGSTASSSYRYCMMDDFTPAIQTDKGAWSESEILGGNAVVKVRASDPVLATIAVTPGFIRISTHVSLTDTLGDLTTSQRNSILVKIQALGYSLTEVQSSLPTNWISVTLKQVLKFITQRRLDSRWDTATKNILVDGPVQACRSIESVDAEVQ